MKPHYDPETDGLCIELKSGPGAGIEPSLS
jgi:hypothetical protein